VAFLLPAFSIKLDVVRIGCIASCVYNLYSARKGGKNAGGLILQFQTLSTGQFHIMSGTHQKFPDKFFLYYRMSTTSYDELLNLICDKTVKTDNIRKSIGPVERLIVTLRTKILNTIN
jgi:hypothetical protein